MPSINDYINSIRTSVYGRDVREAIAAAIEKCRDDYLTKAVRFDINQVGMFDTAQVVQARANIDAANTHQIVRIDEPQSLTTEEKSMARANMDAASNTDLQKVASSILSRFRGKKISIIGDSIDTYDQEGYKIDTYAMYYPALDVNSVEDTWWKQVINASGAVLEVNASWSGSRVTNTASGYESPILDLYDRVSVIGSPDVIFVTLGTNDSAFGVPLGDYDFTTTYTELSEAQFRPAYIKGIKALKALYPSAQIICMVEKILNNNYKDSIETIARELSVEFIDASDYVAAHTVHPGAYGMRQIASLVLYPTDYNLWQKHYPADAEGTAKKIAESQYIVANKFLESSSYSVGDVVLYNGSFWYFKKNHVAGTSWNSEEVDRASASSLIYRDAEIVAHMFNPEADYSAGDYVVYLYHLYQFTSDFTHTGAFPEQGIRRAYLAEDVLDTKEFIKDISYNSADPFNPEQTYTQGDMVIGPNDNRLYRVKTDSYGPAPWPSSGNLNTYFEKTNDSTNVKRALNSLAATWQSGDNHPAGDFVIYKNTLQMYTSDNNAVAVHLGDILKDVGYGLANKFDKTQSYSQGDFVTYANKLYRFTKDHPANTNWIGTEGINADVIGAALGTYLRRVITDIAPMFNPSNSYSSGDYVIYDYRLYQFTSSHTGDWTGNDVRQTSVIGDMPRIRTESLGGDDYKLIIS